MKIKLFKHLLVAIVLLLPIISVYADNLSIESFALRPGDTHLVIVNMSNVQNYTAFQVEVILPKTMEFQQQNDEYITLSERASNNHVIKTNFVDGNKIKLICYSNNNTPFLNDNGKLFSFLVKAKDDFNGEEICLSNIIFSDASNKDTVFPQTSTFISKITPVKLITLNYSDVELKASETMHLTVSVLPETATDKRIIWSVDNPSVATIDDYGNVKAISVGTTTVTAKTADGSNVTAQCKINVIKTQVERITLNYSDVELKASETIHLTVSVLPEIATDKRIIWSVDNPSVATIDDYGNVKAISVGTTTVTAKTADGSNVTAQCKINVIKTQYIVFKDLLVEQLCLANWDTNNDGLLSKGEARNVTNIGDVFKNNKSIKSFDELEYFTGLTFLNNTFYNCTSLESVHLPNSLTTIEDRTFYGCSGLKSIEIPTNITTIGHYAFYGCSGLTAVHINDLSAWCKMNLSSYSNPLHYAHNLYINGEKLTKLVIPEDVININNEVFNGCSNLTSVELGKNVKSIGKYTFQFCTGLTSITIPENVKSIESGAFEECNALTNITINNSTTIINNFAFYKCPQIANIYLLCENPPKVYSYSFSYYTATLYVPQGAKATYAATDTWKNFNNIKEISSNKYFCITYMVDGEIYATDSIASGSTITLIDEPTKEGYTFSGWSEAPETMPAKDITINGTFAVNSYKVIYMVNGKTFATDSIAYGSAITLIDTPTKEGHTFSGWSEAPATMPAQDITISGTFAVNSYKVTYIVDGKTFATDSIAYGSAITLIDIPTKEGYTFSGWSKAPATMPAQDITINGTFAAIPGDANMDDQITIGDIVSVVNYILEKPTKAFSFTGADVTGDNNVSIADIVGIVNIILNPKTEYSVGENSKRGAVAYNSDRLIMADARSETGYVSIPVSLDNSTVYTAFQIDVELPEGAMLTGVSLGCRASSSHSICWQSISDGKVRIVAYSLSNISFNGNTGELFTLDVEAGEGTSGIVTVDNVRMATADGVENVINGCGSTIDINGTTEIGSVDASALKITAHGIQFTGAEGKCVAVYTAAGALVEKIYSYAGEEITLDKGVYIIRVGSKAVKVKL